MLAHGIELKSLHFDTDSEQIRILEESQKQSGNIR